MSDEIQITERESLEAWLNTRPREDSVVIAHRAAMRVAPFWIGGFAREMARNSNLTLTPLLRLNLFFAVAPKIPTPEISAAYAAASAAAFNPIYAAAHAAYVAADVAAAANHATEAVAGSTAVRAPDKIWNAVESDAHCLTSNQALLDLPLWPAGNPLQELWTASIPTLRDTPGGDFWIDWYQRALDGRPQNWDLLRDVALIEDGIWETGGAALDQRITELVVRHGMFDEHRLDDAIAATENAERIEFNPASGKLRLVPQTQLPATDGDYIRRKIVKAVEVFEGQDTQSYGALGPDWNMLRRAVEDAGNLPAELYDACMSAIRRLVNRVGKEECPSPDQDPLIDDYARRLRDICADILGASPEVQDLVRRRASIMGNDALIEAKEPILKMVAAAQEVSEGRLVDVLAEDAQIATASSLPADQRADASFRLSGRLLRIGRAVRFGKDVGTGFIAGNGALLATANYLQAMEFLATSPVVKEAIAAIVRALGF